MEPWLGDDVDGIDYESLWVFSLRGAQLSGDRSKEHITAKAWRVWHDEIDPWLTRLHCFKSASYKPEE